MPLPSPASSDSPRSLLRGVIAGFVCVAAVYVYFLIFAQFAFLALAQSAGLDAVGLQIAMGAQGAAGIVGSILAAKNWTVGNHRLRLIAGFLLCAIGAGFALLANCVQGFASAGAAIGFALGWTTVTVAAGLRSLTGKAILGRVIGAGTGIAYALCNLPVLFNATPRSQTLAAISFALLGAFASAVGPRPVAIALSPSSDYKPRLIAAWVVVLFALVWLDSAAFFIIQHSEGLKALTWGADLHLYGGGLIHLLAALVTGWLIDRGQFSKLAALAFGFLATACILLGGNASGHPAAHLLYVTGVSIYSVILVYYPSRSNRPWLGALVYAVAGWMGSALGIGMAQNLHTVPVWFVVTAATAVAVALAVRTRARRISSGQPFLSLVLLLGFLGFSPDASTAPTQEETLILRGREVYISEGCIHCHSQFVRPGTHDEVLWGPSRPLPENLRATPPLFGNRRQGPDLQNVGNRRSAEWNRLHLIAPAAVVPGSRMPSYAHLFENDSADGPALVAYLNSLGADTLEQRFATIRAWQPAPDTKVLSPDATRRLFNQTCASCHGPEGRGDGPLAAKFVRRPRNLVTEPWLYIASSPGSDTRTALARVIKFGLPGTSMAGHEYLDDGEVMALTDFTEHLHKPPATPASP